MTNPNEQYRAGLARGFNLGYDSGFDAGYDRAVVERREEWYRRGLVKGLRRGQAQGYREAYLLDDTAKATLQQAEEEIHRRVLTAAQVYQLIREALRQRSGFSLVRLGDGEALTLAQEVVLSAAEVADRGFFLEYAGVNLPDILARDQLRRALSQATVVGINFSREPDYLPLLLKVFQAYQLDYRRWNLAAGIINYELNSGGYLQQLLLEEPRPAVLLIGNRAPELAPLLTAAGSRVIGVIAPVRGVKEVNQVLAQAREYSFDLALVAAGVAAGIICPQIARWGQVAMDFGHLADNLISGRSSLQEHTTRRPGF